MENKNKDTRPNLILAQKFYPTQKYNNIQKKSLVANRRYRNKLNQINPLDYHIQALTKGICPVIFTRIFIRIE